MADMEVVRVAYLDALRSFAEHYGFDPEEVDVNIKTPTSKEQALRAITIDMQMPEGLALILKELGVLFDVQ